MAWTEVARNYYFADDALFLQRYCSAQTSEVIGAGGDQRLASLRRVARQLTLLMPEAAHSSPGWSRRPRPVIVVGMPNKRGDIRNRKNSKDARVGLCQIENSLYLWIESTLEIPAQLQWLNQDDQWAFWRATTAMNAPQRHLKRYILPVDLHDDNGVGQAHPLHPAGPLGQLLGWLANQHHHPLSAQLHASVQPLRVVGEPVCPMCPRLLPVPGNQGAA